MGPAAGANSRVSPERTGTQLAIHSSSEKSAPVKASPGSGELGRERFATPVVAGSRHQGRYPDRGLGGGRLHYCPQRRAGAGSHRIYPSWMGLGVSVLLRTFRDRSDRVFRSLDKLVSLLREEFHYRGEISLFVAGDGKLCAGFALFCPPTSLRSGSRRASRMSPKPTLRTNSARPGVAGGMTERLHFAALFCCWPLRLHIKLTRNLSLWTHSPGSQLPALPQLHQTCWLPWLGRKPASTIPRFTTTRRDAPIPRQPMQKRSPSVGAGGH